MRLAVWGLMLADASGRAMAAEPINLGTVSTTASSASYDQYSAPYQAPTQTSLDATQPSSEISKNYIDRNVAPSSNYSEIVNIAPSVQSISPNGPGLMETQSLSIRGLQDGQYNVTFDGIPWGDSNDFTHHSTSYFMAHDLGGIGVDRGPGNASTIGTATFGGTVAVTSKNPKGEDAVTPYATAGSFRTRLAGVQLDTGNAKNGGASAFLDAERLDSNGYLTNAHQHRNSIFYKYVRPVGDNSVVTAVIMNNRLRQNVSVGATRAAIAQYGPNYGLNNDPNSMAYYGYNMDKIQTDFEYLGLKSNLGNQWKLDDKVYTYGYDHYGFNGADPALTTTNASYGVPANNVPGQQMEMNYRSIGNLLRVAKLVENGTVKAGLWTDYQWNVRWQKEVNFTTGAINTTQGANGIDRDMNDNLTTIQPYVEYDWKLSPALTLTPGVKYVRFHRSINAAVNQGTGTPLNYSKTYSSILPALALHYAFNPNWTSYAQVAKGYLAPNLNTFFVANPALNDFSPETTWNYQLGTNWKSRRLALSADVYDIDFSNLVTKTGSATNAHYVNVGGATYKGVEADATYYAGGGFSVYANGSINSAKDKTTNQWLTNAPDHTAAMGVIYNQGGAYGSVIDKYVGRTYYQDANGNNQPLGGYAVTNLAVGYKLNGWLKGAKLQLTVDNVFNKTSIYASPGQAGDGTTQLFWTIPGRSYFASVSASL